MKVILTIRPGSRPGTVVMGTDMKHESKDTVRISNFGPEIKNELDAIVKRCQDAGEVNFCINHAN